MTLEYFVHQAKKEVISTQKYLEGLDKTPAEVLTSVFIERNMNQINRYLDMIEDCVKEEA
jgi:hypothetical protein